MTRYPSVAEVARRLKWPATAVSLPRLILMTDHRRLPDPLPLLRRLPRGSAVIVRHGDTARRRGLVAALRQPCRVMRLCLLVAADDRLAATADGLHLPEAMVRRGWRRRRRSMLVTAAAHSLAAVRRAAARGVDAVLIAPVFATASHPGAPTLGPLRFARMVRASPLPVYALGGIDALAARRLLCSGAAGFAAIGALTAAAQPAGRSGAASA